MGQHGHTRQPEIVILLADDDQSQKETPKLALTCATCWRSGFLNAIVKSPCTKKMAETIKGPKRTWWHKLCALGNTNPAAIAKAWDTSYQLDLLVLNTCPETMVA